jgi:LPXTG-site transpeptidase (sortase) family protein
MSYTMVVHKARIYWRQLLAGLLITAGIGLIGLSYGQVWLANGLFWWQQQSHITYSLDAKPGPNKTQLIQPISTEYGLVIERINVNERVKAEVDPFNADIYLPVLQKYGVAEAKNGAEPGQVGTTYLFGHSTINIWEIGRYHAPFTLLDKVQIGDRVVVYFAGQRYNYIVKQRKVVLPTEVHYLTDERQVPTLVLQTCDPPGENSKRLLLIAELEK